jgi:hypothetical protein
VRFASSELADLLASLSGNRLASEAARGIADGLLPGRLGLDDRVVGLGWATVDTERTLADAADAIDAVGTAGGKSLHLTWEPPTREAAVGASAVVAHVGDIALVILEPDTEARLAGFLARFGEGPCLVYVEAGGLGGMLRPTALGVAGRLRSHEQPWGPYLIAVEERRRSSAA